MIKKVIIKNPSGKIEFKGPLLNLKYKSESIKRTSLELFNDANPCIIHESYAVETLALKAETWFLKQGLIHYPVDESLMLALPDIDFSKYPNCSLELEVK